jgi:hypothetical protein
LIRIAVISRTPNYFPYFALTTLRAMVCSWRNHASTESRFKENLRDGGRILAVAPGEAIHRKMQSSDQSSKGEVASVAAKSFLSAPSSDFEDSILKAATGDSVLQHTKDLVYVTNHAWS